MNNKKIARLLSISFLFLPISFLVASCFNVDREFYIRNINLNGFLTTRISKQKSDNSELIFISTFLFSKNHRPYFLTAKSNNILDGLKTNDRSITFSSSNWFKNDNKNYILSTNEEVKIELETEQFIVFSTKPLTANTNSKNKFLKLYDFQLLNIIEYHFDKNKGFDHKFIYAYTPLVFKQVNQNKQFQGKIFFSKGENAKNIKIKDFKLTIENDHQINQSYLGAPIFYKDKIVGILGSFQNIEQTSENEIKTNTSNF